MVICPDCGKEVPDAKFCKNCGARLPEVEEAVPVVSEEVNPVVVEETIPVTATNVTEEEVKQEETKSNVKFCYNCGYELNGEFKFCPNCGADLVHPSAGKVQKRAVSSNGEKNIIIAIILSVIFPGLGQFYLGLNHKGLIFLIAYIISAILILLLIGFILVFVVWIWALIDTIISTNAINRGESVEDKLLG